LNSTNPTETNRPADRNGNTPFSYKWLFVIGIGMLLLGIILFALREVLMSLAVLVIGISLFTAWVYLSMRLKQQVGIPVNKQAIIGRIQPRSKEECTCPICKHKESNICLNDNCACCVMMKNDSIVGHSNNPLQ
jgi:hypothetical protein